MDFTNDADERWKNYDARNGDSAWSSYLHIRVDLDPDPVENTWIDNSFRVLLAQLVLHRPLTCAEFAVELLPLRKALDHCYG